MTFPILLSIFALGIGLSADAFSVALTDGLTITDINRKRSFFIAFVFGFFQALMPLIGFWIVDLVELAAGQTAGAKASSIAATTVAFLAFFLLLGIGGKMLIESIRALKKKPEEKPGKLFSVREVILYGLATAIDAFTAGIALHAGLSDRLTVWLHVAIIFALTFGLSLVGLFLGKKITKLLKGHYEISGIIGGSILILLAVWILVSHLLGI